MTASMVVISKRYQIETVVNSNRYVNWINIQFSQGVGAGDCCSFILSSLEFLWELQSLPKQQNNKTIGITNVYDESSPTALVVERVFNAASAEILIYMALVDLLAADFTNPRIQKSGGLRLGCNIALFLVSGCMSLLAKLA
ncbi:hypothetical protein VNO77_44836 [Canavalia gladiata]|uniref:Uncharacterized protein n=1 Tax=Canavalia gladiata TaxID=3824 RepID=A0AAN9PQN6_CANGL